MILLHAMNSTPTVAVSRVVAMKEPSTRAFERCWLRVSTGINGKERAGIKGRKEKGREGKGRKEGIGRRRKDA